MFSKTETFFDPEQKIWSGPKRKDLYSSEMTLGDVILHSLSSNPKKIIHVFDPTGETLSAGELLEQSKNIAMNLIKMGLLSGDVVGFAASNTTHLTSLVIATFLCGTPMHAVYSQYDKETMKQVFEISKPKIFFCEVDNYDVVQQVVQELHLNAEIFLMNGNVNNTQNIHNLFIAGEEQVPQKFPCANMLGNSIAMIVCSSGTSGAPKAVPITNTILLNQDSLYNINNESVLLSMSGLHWVSAWWTLIASLKACVKIVLTKNYDTPEHLLELFEKYRVTHMFSSPIHISQINKIIDSKSLKKLNSLYMIVCGGVNVSANVLKFNDFLGNDPKPGLTVGYGMTETGSLCVINDAGPGTRRNINGGRLNANFQIRIVDEVGNNLGIGEEGMIYIKLPNVWPGYLNNSKATREAYENGWLKSGDIGYFEEDGYLTVCGRECEIFKSKRFPICAPKIEEVIMQLEEVLEVCVFGIPDDMVGNLIACAVVVTNDEKITKQDIELHVKSEMDEKYHLSGGVFFVDALPHTGSGKLIRRKVPELIKQYK